MNLTSFRACIIPECNHRRSIQASHSIDIIVGNSLLIKQLWLLISILLLLNIIRIIIKLSLMQFGPFIQINKIILCIVTTPLNGINLVRILIHLLKSRKLLKG